ncbi:MAG: RNA methyltransferase [Verrucomicrobiota bacterium]
MISSTSNERVKHARRVRDGREEGLIFIDGLRLAEEALRSGVIVETAFVDDEASDARLESLVAEMTARRVPVFTASRSVLDALADTVQSQGVILIAKRPAPDAGALFQDQTGLLLVSIDRVQDPGNMGTLLRTAEAAGAHGVLVLGGSADVYSPKVLRSSMGSAFRLPVITEVSQEKLMELRQNHALHLTAAAGEGEIDYDRYDWRQPTLLLLGNEGRGVSAELMQACDTRLRIPMANGVESLNVAAAGAVMLFEASRQRRRG